MSAAIRNFLKSQDQFGSTVNLNYRGMPSYGTLLGGCISLMTTTFFTVFIIFQVFAWIFEPNYD